MYIYNLKGMIFSYFDITSPIKGKHALGSPTFIADIKNAWYIDKNQAKSNVIKNNMQKLYVVKSSPADVNCFSYKQSSLFSLQKFNVFSFFLFF